LSETAKECRVKIADDNVYLMSAVDRIELIRRGLPAARLAALSAELGMPKGRLLTLLGISRTTVSRKARTLQPLSPEVSERVLGLESLIGQVDVMVRESGELAGFDPAKWVSGWLLSAVPALGGGEPASYLDTVEGQKLLSDLLVKVQSGAYA
jgi:putative toxin-antitoxin system antitoxin component (TIGR02293 family)